jgi:hypothetical protein
MCSLRRNALRRHFGLAAAPLAVDTRINLPEAGSKAFHLKDNFPLLFIRKVVG